MRNYRKVPWAYRGFVRKTTRRNGPRLPRSATATHTMRFELPPMLALANRQGSYCGGRVTLRSDGSVAVTGWSDEHVLRLAGQFLLAIASQHPDFSMAATINDGRDDKAPKIHRLALEGGKLKVKRGLGRKRIAEVPPTRRKRKPRRIADLPERPDHEDAEIGQPAEEEGV